MQPVTKMYFFGIFTTLLHDMKQGSTEDSSEPLLSYFKQLFPLNSEEQELVKAKFYPRLYRKRQLVLQEGDVCTGFNFAVRGCLSDAQ